MIILVIISSGICLGHFLELEDLGVSFYQRAFDQIKKKVFVLVSGINSTCFPRLLQLICTRCYLINETFDSPFKEGLKLLLVFSENFLVN